MPLTALAVAKVFCLLLDDLVRALQLAASAWVPNQRLVLRAKRKKLLDEGLL